MTQWKKLGKEQEAFLSFPVLAALARRPLRTRELAQIMQVSREAVRRRVNELARLGYIVQRASDMRWVAVVQLQKAGVLEPTSVPGVTPDTPPKKGEPLGDYTFPSPLEVLEARQAASAPAEAPEAVQAAESPSTGLTAAQRWAMHFKVPAFLDSMGELSVGKQELCVACAHLTVIKYGGRALCPDCVSLWQKVDAGGEDGETR